MSYYYNYYIGYKHNNKLYPLGPYNHCGKLREVICRSRNFASTIHERFYEVRADQFSDELRCQFSYQYDGETEVDNVKYILIRDLPSGSMIKTGYFLKTDVEEYERSHDAFDLFYDTVSPTVYAAMISDESRGAKPVQRYDADGEPFPIHTSADYMYYAYEDTSSEEYEAMIIRLVADMLDYDDIPKGAELVALETEG